VLIAAGSALACPGPGYRPPERPVAAIERAQLALAERLKMDAAASVDLAERAFSLASQAQADLARDLRRVDTTYAKAAQELDLHRRVLTTALVAVGRSSEDAHARLVVAGLARGAAAVAARVDRLRSERVRASLLLRGADADRRRRDSCRATAANAMAAAGERWRAALRGWMAAVAGSAAAVPRRRPPGIVLVVVDASTLGSFHERAPQPVLLQPVDTKRAISLDQRLDRGILRANSAAPRRQMPKRLWQEPVPSPEPLMPIAGVLEPGLLASPGRARPGFVIATTVDQIVSAPVAGRVVFAAPFRGLGPLLIIDRGGGYHVVLAGLTRLDVREGASLVAGQSVGEIVAQEVGPARLQVELRYRGSPIEPASWLTAHQDKVRS
jgi:murein DD-endopeptidase MepM/ murein hydrolase activator NlpD